MYIPRCGFKAQSIDRIIREGEIFIREDDWLLNWSFYIHDKYGDHLVNPRTIKRLACELGNDAIPLYLNIYNTK